MSQIARQYETVNTVNASRFKGDVDNIAAATERNVSENTFEQRTWGLYGEAFVNYDNRLFINAGLRRDASNLIGSNVASIYYPSLSVAYNWKIKSSVLHMVRVDVFLIPQMHAHLTLWTAYLHTDPLSNRSLKATQI